MKKCFNYVTTCCITGLQYVGSYSAKESRSNYFGSGKKIQEVIKEFGKENFSKVEIEVPTFEEKQELELMMIDWFDTLWPKGYNLREVSSKGMFGKISSKKTKQFMSESHLGKKHTEEIKQYLRVINLGKTHTEEIKQRLSELFSGEDSLRHKEKHTEEIKQRLKDVNLGKNNPMFKKKQRRVTCKFCGKEDVAVNIYSRDHGISKCI